MPKPRYTQVSLEATPYYHCVSRCVRRAFLCGENKESGQSYEHRRQWIEDKLHEIAQIFAIDLCAYAVMSNHYHVVLHVDVEQSKKWTFDEVINRWHRLFNGHALSQRYMQGVKLCHAERVKLEECVTLWRTRLTDISWFMRVVNEGIARQANSEDNCTGRFWEGRYQSQALLDDAAILACMAYVDLNPIRARMAHTPEESDHTSIKHRIEKAQQTLQPNHIKQQPKTLMPFAGDTRQVMPKGLHFKLDEYLKLVDWTGRILREDKRGAIDNTMPPILTRLNIEQKHWLYLAQHFESPFKGMVGSVYKLKQACQVFDYTRTPGLRSCEMYFP